MAGNEMELLCIGNALVDVFACVDDGILNRYGITLPVQHVEFEKIKNILSELKDQDMVISSGGGARKTHARHRACSYGECNTAPPKENLSSVIIASGGGAANVAKIAGFLGADVCFSGAINGADEHGRLFEKELISAGVLLKPSLKHSPSGVCLYLQKGEETRIAASPSAALELSESDISEEDFKKAKVVVIDGFILGRAGLVRRIFDLIGKYGKTAALDLSSVSIAAEHAAEITEYAGKHSLILFMNEQEAAAFCKAAAFRKGMTNNALNFQEACSFFQSLTSEKSFPIIAVKLGKSGAICFSGGSMYRIETQAVIPHETTGAGDAFSAAFLTAWVRGKSLPECADLGNRAARIVLDVEGTRVDQEMLKSIARQLKQ